MLVGHEPTLSTFASMLCSGNGGSFIDLKKAGAILLSNGFTLVHDLTGGVDAWRQANLPIVKK